MTDLLKKAFEEASGIEKNEQDALAELISPRSNRKS
jgi:hypothetical protein